MKTLNLVARLADQGVGAENPAGALQTTYGETGAADHD
jgi:hypothetical protein